MSTPGPLSEKANYEKLEFLGEGTFGVVHKYRCKRSQDIVAIKKIRLKQAKVMFDPPESVNQSTSKIGLMTFLYGTS
jgi:serine/threonine protein kinase